MDIKPKLIDISDINKIKNNYNEILKDHDNYIYINKFAKIFNLYYDFIILIILIIIFLLVCYKLNKKKVIYKDKNNIEIDYIRNKNIYDNNINIEDKIKSDKKLNDYLIEIIKKQINNFDN